MPPHSSEKWNNVAQAIRVHESTVIEPKTDPEIIHKRREDRDHNRHANRPTKLITKEKQGEFARNSQGKRVSTDEVCWSSFLSVNRPASVMLAVDFAAVARWRSSPLVWPFDIVTAVDILDRERKREREETRKERVSNSSYEIFEVGRRVT